MSYNKAHKLSLRNGYFRCRYFSTFRRKITWLLFIMGVLVLLHLATQTLPVSHSVAQHAAQRPFILQADSRPPEQEPSRLSYKSPQAQLNQEEGLSQDNGHARTFSDLAMANNYLEHPAEEAGSSPSPVKEGLVQSSPRQGHEDSALVAYNRSDGKGNTGQHQEQSHAKIAEQGGDKNDHKAAPTTEPDPQDGKRKDKEKADEKKKEKLELLKEVMAIRENQPDHELTKLRGELHHVFFLKVHKAASTTVMNILYRFAIDRNLNVMLPAYSNVFSEGNKMWRRSVMPLPPDATHFDILCNHLVFSKATIRYTLAKDAKFIGIVREPFDQFLSAFFYYTNVYHVRYLSHIPGDDPVVTYLQNPHAYETRARAGSFTRSRMSLDFGLSRFMMMNIKEINKHINYLNSSFDLVMVSERFDESMVLMKRLLGWQLQDVIYIKNNVFTKPHHNYTSEQKLKHKRFNPADYILYDHFAHLFQKRVEQEGKLFKEEVATFVSLREKVEQFCQESKAKDITLDATDWTPVFQVKRLDCRLMVLPEVPFVDIMKTRQYGNHTMVHDPRRLRPRWPGRRQLV